MCYCALGILVITNQIWLLQVPMEFFRAWSERPWLFLQTSHTEFKSPVNCLCESWSVGTTKQGSENGGKQRGGGAKKKKRARVWCMRKIRVHTLKCSRRHTHTQTQTHTHTCIDWTCTRQLVFAEPQVQCPAAALPCMPGAWIISPSRGGAIKAYGEHNKRRRRWEKGRRSEVVQWKGELKPGCREGLKPRTQIRSVSSEGGGSRGEKEGVGGCAGHEQ